MSSLPVVGHSVIYGPVPAAEQGAEEGLLAAKEEGGVFREVADDRLSFTRMRGRAKRRVAGRRGGRARGT